MQNTNDPGNKYAITRNIAKLAALHFARSTMRRKSNCINATYLIQYSYPFYGGGRDRESGVQCSPSKNSPTFRGMQKRWGKTLREPSPLFGSVKLMVVAIWLERGALFGGFMKFGIIKWRFRRWGCSLLMKSLWFWLFVWVNFV